MIGVVVHTKVDFEAFRHAWHSIIFQKELPSLSHLLKIPKIYLKQRFKGIRMWTLSFRGNDILNVGELQDISTAQLQNPCHPGLFFSLLLKAGKIQPVFLFLISLCSPLYLLGFCYPPRRKAEACEVRPVWPFIYLTLTKSHRLLLF